MCRRDIHQLCQCVTTMTNNMRSTEGKHRTTSSSSSSSPYFKTNVFTKWLCLAMIMSLCMDCVVSAHTPSFSPDRFQFTGSPEHRYFRYLTIHADNLYVGAMDAIYKLDASDIRNAPLESSYRSDPRINSTLLSNRQTCLMVKQDEVLCENHIRAIAVVPESDLIWACGTGALNPQDLYLDLDTLSVNAAYSDQMGPSSGRNKCPYDPDFPSTMVYVPEGNANDVPAVYTATVTTVEGNTPIIRRPALRLRQDSTVVLASPRSNGDKWLNDPTFVASFDVGPHVFFFFYESSLEHQNVDDQPIYSRVARICKNDRGGTTALEQNWTGYLKSRLACSIPGTHPYYFNKLVDIYFDSDTQKFYGLFTTTFPPPIQASSAICGFEVGDINNVLDTGPFSEQTAPDKFWTDVPSDRVTNPRPGQCTDSKQIDGQVLHFIRERPLISQSVPSTTGRPLYTTFTHQHSLLQVEAISLQYTLFYLATMSGEVMKVGMWRDAGEVKSRVLATWTLFDASTTVRQMKLEGGMLYVSTDDVVMQLSTRQCGRYDLCTSCVVDPHCDWTDGQCRAATASFNTGALSSSPVNTCGSRCEQNVVSNRFVKMYGESVSLGCTSDCEVEDVVWKKNGQEVVVDQSRFFVSRDNELLIHNATWRDSGLYTCTSLDVTLASHHLNVTACENVDCLWEQEFNNWCSAFEEYQTDFKQWSCMKSNCVKDGCIPKEASDGCFP